MGAGPRGGRGHLVPRRAVEERKGEHDPVQTLRHSMADFLAQGMPKKLKGATHRGVQVLNKCSELN